MDTDTDAQVTVIALLILRIVELKMNTSITDAVASAVLSSVKRSKDLNILNSNYKIQF